MRRHPGLALTPGFPTQLCFLCTGDVFVDIFILTGVIRHIFNAHIYAEKQISTRKIPFTQKMRAADKLVCTLLTPSLLYTKLSGN